MQGEQFHKQLRRSTLSSTTSPPAELAWIGSFRIESVMCASNKKNVDIEIFWLFSQSSCLKDVLVAQTG